MSEQGSSQYDFNNVIRGYVDPHELHHYNFADDWEQHEAQIDNICKDKKTGEGILTPAFEHRIKRTLYKLFAQLDANIVSALSSGDKIYTGTAGIAMLKLLNDERFHYKSQTLDKAYELFLKSADECPVNDRISFLNGNAGIVALAAVAHHKAGNLEKSQDLLEKLVQFSTYCSLKNSSAPPDEVLYGRAGYLYSLLYVRKHVPNAGLIVHDSIIKRVAQDIIDSGIQSAKAVNSTSPLYYKWHGKEYVGAAHGYSGIFQVLLMARKQKFVSYSALKNYLVPAMDYVLPAQYPSRNYPTSMESRTGRDRLVQWCHGAPGMIYMGVEAYEVLRDEYYGRKFRDLVSDLAEVTWYRGLLKKGYSLCHGVAGNGYALLRVYHLNRDLKYLNRAARFAEWCLDYGANQTHVPDRPWSLFEGISGVIYFLIDMLNFEEAKFPGVDL